MRVKNSLISIAVAGLLVACGGGSDSSINEASGGNGEGNTPVVSDAKEVKILAQEKKNADFSNVGAQSVKMEAISENLGYNEALKTYVDSTQANDGMDSYVRDIAYKDGKIVVASVYHNSLSVFDASGKTTYNSFKAFPKAGHGVNVNGEEFNDDARTGASENYLDEVKFSPSEADVVYLALKPKYIGQGKDNKMPHENAGLYKARLDSNNKIDENAAIYFKGKFYGTEFLTSGNIITLAEDGTLYELDKDFKEVKKQNIPNAKAFDVKDDKLFVLVLEDEKYNIEQRSINNFALVGEKIPYNKTYSPKYNSLFELTPDAKKLATFEGEEVCLTDIEAKKVNCANIGYSVEKSKSSMSPDGKYIAFTKGAIVNVSGELPSLVKTFELTLDENIQKQTKLTRNTSYGINFIQNDKLLISKYKRFVDTYKISTGDNITAESKFADAVKSVESRLDNMTKGIKIYDKKGKIRGTSHFENFVLGANVDYKLSKEFDGYINEKGEFLKIPEQKITGKIVATITMLKDGKAIKEKVIEKEISIEEYHH